MNKFYINGKFFSTRLTGVQRVGHELSHRLFNGLTGKGVTCEILQPPTWMSKSRKRALWTTLWEQFILPLRARDGFLINLCNTAPILLQKNQLVVLHDAAVFDMPNNYSKSYARWAKFQMRKLSGSSSILSTVSEFSRQRLSLALEKSKSDFFLLREGSNHVHNIGTSNFILDRLNIRERKYILAVGSLQPGKNFRNLLTAMNEIDNELILVIAGGGDSIVFSSGVKLDSDRYIQAGYVSDEELKSLYKNATCFVQASTYEGFGLPLVEAMAIGTPVVCSSAASLPEVCLDAAIYFDPQSPSDIAKAINKVAFDENLKKSLIQAGSIRADHYNWDTSAKELIDYLLLKSKNKA